MAAEIQNQYVSIEHCKTKSRICRGFWAVLNGVPIEKVDLTEDQRGAIKKYMQASNTGKSVYQIAQETGISSFRCGELHKTRKRYRRAFCSIHWKSNQCKNLIPVTKSQKELLDFLKLQKEPVNAYVCAVGLQTTFINAFSRLERLSGKGLVRKNKKNGYVIWEIVQ
ncbi:hypothetical protein [Methanosarcina mazei]|uniref:Uncharacterized protein n=1 Tax=Methanosarcina mazei TaxID=2209 RepID=A0A0F8L378_METMZ|nr:hypothetical protein [Methanosarcina mazei]KKG94563.1 hypothetical protein DU69_13850 [Methanosarcina mazei]